ncbi:ABC transporter substrate-binding protein [Paraglaciecola aquimarina]|uniref:ABC transporter substrate-binding protein n=1 Tax=Paraglaciecola algarum TaxID=3050085 RepID=A0ABS9D6N2_9ALTE|nr:ABC transporter substrate-binding protein [Paraglaciecola sp. G1-23]
MTQAVSDALGFEIDVAYAPEAYRNRFGAAAYIKEVLAKDTRLPDLIITSFWVGSEQKILSMLDTKKIPLISINSDISDEQFAELGKPREIFPYWLAHLSPNDTIAGSKLANAFINLSREKRCFSSDCKVNIFAITGMSYSAVSVQRVKGLEQILQQDLKSHLLNVVYGNWDRERVAGMANTIFSRHKDIHAFWIASDVMAYGLEDGLKNSNISMPKDTIIGSIDWSPASIEKIKQNKMHVSLGGHFLEGGLSLILFYDYLNGYDFAQEMGVVIKTEMSILDKNNVEQLGPFLQKPKWSKSRLQSYSKSLTPARKQYNFNPKQIIVEQLTAINKRGLSNIE